MIKTYDEETRKAMELPDLPDGFHWGYVQIGPVHRNAMIFGIAAIFIDDDDDFAMYNVDDDRENADEEQPWTRYCPRKLVVLFLKTAEARGWTF